MRLRRANIPNLNPRRIPTGRYRIGLQNIRIGAGIGAAAGPAIVRNIEPRLRSVRGPRLGAQHFARIAGLLFTIRLGAS